VRIHGITAGELDPAATENDVIVDLDRAGCKNRSKPAPDFGRRRQVISAESGT
jgi:hypothetical protein